MGFSLNDKTPRHSRPKRALTEVAALIVGFSIIGGWIVETPAEAETSEIELSADSFFTVGGGGQTVGILDHADGPDFTLTDAEQDRSGAVWYKNRIDLSENFHLKAEIYLGDNRASGADGIAFVIQGESGAQLSHGGGLGYGGFSNVFAVEFDTNQNNDLGDPPSDHWGMIKKGAVSFDPANSGTHASNHSQFGVAATRKDNVNATTFSTADLTNSKVRAVEFIWTASTQSMEAKFDINDNWTYEDNEIITATGLGLHGSDSLFGDDNVYLGFTASTGFFTNLQKVRFFSDSTGTNSKMHQDPMLIASERTNTDPQLDSVPEQTQQIALANGTQSFSYTLSDDSTVQNQWQIEVASSNTSVATAGGSFSSDTAASITVNPLSAGGSTITATFTDADGKTVQDTFDLTVSRNTLSSSFDNSTFFDPEGNLPLTLSEESSPVSGKNLRLYESDGTLVATVAAENLTENSSTSFTVEFPSDLDLNTSYYLHVDAGAFESDDANPVPSTAITDSTTINFKTSKVFQTDLELALDAAVSDSYNPSTSGSTWSDLTENNNDLSLINAPSHSNTGIRSFSFDSANTQYGEFAANDLLDESEYTKLMWIKPNVGSANHLFSSSGTDAHNFWANADAGTDSTCTRTGDKLGAAHEGENGLSTVKSSSCLKSNIWNMVAVTFDSDPSSPTNGWRLYANDSQVGSNTGDITVPDTSSPYTTQIGAYAGADTFDGEIAEVYLYNRALTSTEILSIFNASKDNFEFSLDTVSFDPNGGTVSVLNLKEDATTGTVTLPTATKTGSVLRGWFDAATGGTKIGGAGASYTPPSTLTLFAQWGGTVTYDAGGGTVSPTSATYTDSALTLPTPTKDDSAFLGWYDAATGGSRIGGAGDTYTPSSSLTLYAQWEDSFTVTYDAGGGTVTPGSSDYKPSTGALTLPTPTKSDSAFLGWYDAATDGSRIGGAGDTYTPPSSLTLYALWEDSFTVTYDAGGGAVTPGSSDYKPSTGALTLPTPNRDNYVFDGWFSAATGGSKIGDAGASYTPGSTGTIHARWTQASLAGLDDSDLTEVLSYTVVAGTSLSNTLTLGSSSVTLNVPADAFDAGVVLKVYSVANNDRAEALLADETDFVNSFVVAWTDTDTTVPVANSPLTLTVVDSSIRTGAKVYSIVGDQSTVLATATQNGTVAISFTADPLIAIANPEAEPEPSGGSDSGGSGGGSGGISPSPTPITTRTPVLDEDQLIEIENTSQETILITGENLQLVESVSHQGQELQFEVSQTGRQITVTLHHSSPGEIMLELVSGAETMEQMVTVKETVNPSIVNAGTFKGVVAIYAKNYEGQRLSAKVGKDWVIVDSLDDRFVRIVERVRWVGHDLSVRIFINRQLVRTVDLTTM
mgnify:CR=1 FL=1